MPSISMFTTVAPTCINTFRNTILAQAFGSNSRCALGYAGDGLQCFHMTRREGSVHMRQRFTYALSHEGRPMRWSGNKYCGVGEHNLAKSSLEHALAATGQCHHDGRGALPCHARCENGSGYRRYQPRRAINQWRLVQRRAPHQKRAPTPTNGRAVWLTQSNFFERPGTR
jgi:hypothetical protein